MADQSRIYSFMPRRYGDLKAAVAALIHAAGGEQNAADHCRVGKEAGDVFERAEVFLADGEIDHLEVPELLKEIDDLLAVAADMRAAVRARLTDGA